MITIEEIEAKLQRLRDEYKTATISRQKTIMLQARALQIAKSKLEKKYE